MVEYASTLRYPDGLGNKRLYRPRTCSFINSWLILYLLVIKLVEAGHHLLIILKQRRIQRDSADKTSRIRPNTIRRRAQGGPRWYWFSEKGSEVWTSGRAKKFSAFRQAFSNYKTCALGKEEYLLLDICIKTVYIPLTIPADVAPYIGTHINALKRRSLLVV